MDYEIDEVSTGEVKTVSTGKTLNANALGSCIAVIVYDPYQQIGGMAHIMLPGAADKSNSHNKFRYAEDGIEELLRQLTYYGSDISKIRCVIAGGANVLKRRDDTICEMNINSTFEILRRNNISINAHSLGGEKRRRVSFNIAKGLVLCRVGNDQETVLWTEERWNLINYR